MDQFSAAPTGVLGEGASRAPIPAWVDLSPYTIPTQPNPHFVANGLCTLIDDTQVDLCGPERQWFCRHADLITANVGAEHAARFESAYDPRFERLEVHSVRVLRAGAVIDHTNASGFEVFRRERNMERLVFDGRLTVHFTVPDVRVGDVVETCYSIYGMRRSLGNRHATWITFEWPAGIIDARHRLRVPEGKIVRRRAVNNPPETQENTADGVSDFRWRSVERPSLKMEHMAPPWIVQRAEIQFSEWRDWAEVAGAFTPLYDDAGAMPPEIDSEILRIATTEATPAAKAAAVLRFVQGAIRYLAMSLGEGGFTPRPLAEIWETRYGDCKDKSKLFVEMARRLGLDASPALVNTAEGYALDEWLPTAYAFNHCIVRLAIDGQVYWLDPTRALQPSRLDKVGQSYLGWALALTPTTHTLERMADPPIYHCVETIEKAHLGARPDAPVRYEWKHIFRDHRAEGVRDRLARDGAVGMFKSYADDVQRVWPKATPLRQEVLSDDQAENVVTLVEVYEIGEAWRPAENDLWSFSTLDLTMRSNLLQIDQSERKHPVYIGAYGRFTRRVEITCDFPLTVTPWDKKVDISAGSCRLAFAQDGPKASLLLEELHINKLALPANEASAYRDMVKECHNSDITITQRFWNGRFGNANDGGEKFNFWNAARWTFVIVWLIYLLVKYAVQ
jgi:transglutaminase-like putative cysteine protease